MLIGEDDISSDVITMGTCFSMFVYICAHFCFALSRRGATGELKVEFKLQRLVASSPSFSCPAARVPWRACSQVMKCFNRSPIPKLISLLKF